MRPVDGFIAMCYILSDSDHVVDMAELVELKEVLVDKGFDLHDINRIETQIMNMDNDDKLEYGIKTMAAVSKLSADQLELLVECMTKISTADGRADTHELELIQLVKGVCTR